VADTADIPAVVQPGPRGFTADGLPGERWKGRTEDRDVAFDASVVVTDGDSYRMRQARANGGTILNKT
jgi:hypothetical protein